MVFDAKNRAQVTLWSSRQARLVETCTALVEARPSWSGPGNRFMCPHANPTGAPRRCWKPCGLCRRNGPQERETVRPVPRVRLAICPGPKL